MGLVFTIVVLKYLHAHHTVVVEITGTKKINSLSHKSPESIYVDARVRNPVRDDITRVTVWGGVT